MELITLRRKLSLISVFCIPLKLSWTYIFLSPAILILMFEYFRGSKKSPKNELAYLGSPYVLFLLTIAISCLFALNPVFSCVSVIKLAFLSLSILVFYELFTELGFQKILKTAFIAQVIAAVHSIIELAAEPYLSRWFVGDVSESGQLALTCVVAGVLALEGKQRFASDFKREGLKGLFLFYSALILAFFGSSSFVNYILGSSLFVVAFFYALFKRKKFENQESDFFNLCLVIFFPLLVAGLLSELKRGPIAGVIISISVILLINHRKLFVGLLTIFALSFLAFPDLQARFGSSLNHYFIRGGRHQMWTIGAELVGRYPLGLGHGSSEILQKFSRDIPPEHEHFHNNFLNILIETGWIPSILIVIFLYRIFATSFKRNRTTLSLAVGLAILSSQIAGLVEYNMGDSEVLIMMFLYLGLLGFQAYSSESELSNSNSA